MSTHCSEAGAEYELYDAEDGAASKRMRRSGEDIYAEDVKSHLLESYGALQYDRLVERGTIQNGVKEGVVQPLVNKMKEEIFRRLATSPEAYATLEQQIGAVFDVHRGLETSAKEEHALNV